MRKVIVNNIVSLDGFYADPAGNPLVLDMDAAFDRANRESIEAADLVLLGRDSFEGFSAYWPFIADAPEPEDPDDERQARRVDQVNRAISRRYNAIPKVVISDRGAVPADNAWASSTTLVRREDAGAWVAAAARAGEGDILIFGSRRTWNGLLAAGLIDELHLMVSARALGEGVPLFAGPVELEPLEARRFPDSRNVQLRYRVVKPGAQ